MNIRQIGYYVAVFETRSFTAAAHRCSVTVQAISKSINELEQAFGTKFFDRGNTGVRPTSEGRSFYLKARNAVNAYAEVEEFSVEDLSPKQPVAESSHAQWLSVGLCVPSFAKEERLYSSLSSLVERGCAVHTTFTSVRPEVAQQELEAKRLDALLTIGVYDNATDECVPVGTLPTEAAVSLGHPLAHRPFIGIDDLRAYPTGQSAVFDDFNQSIFWEYKRAGLLGEVRLIEGPEEARSFLCEDNGYFLNAMLPVEGQTGPGTTLLPIAGEGALSIPVCLVSLKRDKPAAYHVVESFLIQLVGSINSMGSLHG